MRNSGVVVEDVVMGQESRPGNGLWGWLGRQFGYVKKAVKTDVTRQIVHRQQQVQEAKLPERPEVTLRRTVIDEVIVDKRPKKPSAGTTDAHG